jgi:uncharacterized membrane protein YhaH (DUF805 family)
MKSSFQRDFWIYIIAAVLGAILLICVAGILLIRIMGQPAPDLLAALGVVAAHGLFRLLILPPLD